MSTFIDFSGTAGMPIPSELEESASAILDRSFIVNEAMHRAHAKWSLLAGAYAAPEQELVERALDLPRDAAEAVLRAASHSASALRVFAAAVEGIHRKRLELQAEAAALEENEDLGAVPAGRLPAGNTSPTLYGLLLQSKADQLALELSDAEDECIRALARLERSSDAPERRGL